MKTRSFDFRDSLLSLLAITIALFFIFPLYWGFSTSLRNPLDTFTVTGVGLPWLNFSPTLNNWISQLEIVEMRNAVINSVVVSFSTSLLTLCLGVPAAYALARFRFKKISNRI